MQTSSIPSFIIFLATRTYLSLHQDILWYITTVYSTCLSGIKQLQTGLWKKYLLMNRGPSYIWQRRMHQVSGSTIKIKIIMLSLLRGGVLNNRVWKLKMNQKEIMQIKGWNNSTPCKARALAPFPKKKLPAIKENVHYLRTVLSFQPEHLKLSKPLSEDGESLSLPKCWMQWYATKQC